MQDQSLDHHLLTVVTTLGLEQQRKEWRTQSSPFDCGHNFRIGAAEKGMEDSIIKTRGDGIVLPRIMPALTPQGCHSAVSIQPLQPVHKTSASIITF